MSRNRFVIYQPTKGKYKRKIKPYLKWYERSEMTPTIPIDGEYYRILTGSPFWSFKFHKMVVCHENGQIEEAEGVTRELFRITEYLTRYRAVKQNMAFDLRHGQRDKHEPLLRAFQTMTDELRPKLSQQETEAMDFHLLYLKELYRLSVEIASEVKHLMNYKQELENLTKDQIPQALINKVIKHFQRWEKLRSELEAYLVEDGERARPIVRKVLKNSSKTQHLSRKNDIRKVIEEMNGADDAVKRYIENKRQVVNIPSEEHYIQYLRHEKTLEKVIQGNVDVMIDIAWVFSSNK